MNRLRPDARRALFSPAPGDALRRLVFLVGALACAGCATPGRPSPAPGYGSVMADVARRFELLGRAANGGRFALADYELGELEELFTEALPHAAPPKEGHPEVLPPLAAAFARDTLGELRRALTARDDATFTAAFARTAAACNACHTASGHGFIVVPSEPGRPVPDTSPLSTPEPAGG